MEKKTIELKSSEIEIIRSGINDSVNLLADDELSELFGELHCGNDYCPPQKYYNINEIFSKIYENH